jgi:hypothetical protein
MLPERAYLAWRQELAACRNALRLAGGCRELWHQEGKKKATWDRSSGLLLMIRRNAVKFWKAVAVGWKP